MLAAKSQTTVEFMFLFVALLLIFLPIFYLVSDYSIKSGEDFSINQVKRIGNKLVDESREVYYLGLYSREIVSVKMPDGIDGMSAINIIKSESGSIEEVETYLEFGLTTDGVGQSMVFPSEVPLMMDSGCSGDDGIAMACSADPDIDCIRCSFPKETYSSGTKTMQIQTVVWDETDTYAVRIMQVET